MRGGGSRAQAVRRAERGVEPTEGRVARVTPAREGCGAAAAGRAWASAEHPAGSGNASAERGRAFGRWALGDDFPLSSPF